MRWIVMAVVLCGVQTWARERSVGECREELKKFAAICEKMCDDKLKKKNPKGSEYCHKGCRDQTAIMEKECAHGKR